MILHCFEKDLHYKLISTLPPKMFYCHTMFIDRIEMFTFSSLKVTVMSGGYKTDFNLNNIISNSVKNSPANVIKVLAATPIHMKKISISSNR